MNKEAILRGFYKRAKQQGYFSPMPTKGNMQYDGSPGEAMTHYMSNYPTPTPEQLDVNNPNYEGDPWNPKDPHIQRMSKLYTAIHKKNPDSYISPEEFDSTIAMHGANYAGLYNKKHNLKMPNRKQFKTDQEAWDAEDKMSNKMLNDEMYKFRDLRHFSNARSKEFHKYVTGLTPKQFMNYQKGKF